MCFLFPDAADQWEELEEEKIAGEHVFRGQAGSLVNKVRQCARVFLITPRLNDKLSRYAAEDGCNLKIVLQLDV